MLLKYRLRAYHKGIVTNVDEFHDRFYLIHGIYGHVFKDIDNGDESYFRPNILKESL
jgi:hypothetical protein